MPPETIEPDRARTEQLTDYERLLRLEDTVEELSHRIQELEQKMNDLFDNILFELASDRKRITALEDKLCPRPTSSVFEMRRENVLAIIRANGGSILQKDLADRLELDKTEVSRIVRSLEDDRLVKTKRSQSNKKIKVIYMTNS